MEARSVVRRVLLAVLPFLVALTAVAVEPLFTDLEDPTGQALTMGIAGVARYRTVQVDLALLGTTAQDGTIDASPELFLNLFADMNVRAVLERTEPGFAGDWVWVGHLAPPDIGRAIFAVSDRTLTGTVEVGGRVFQIRNNGGLLHIIRELPPATSAELAPAMYAPAAGSSLEMEVHRLTNVERAAHRLHLLAWNDTLGRAARAHSLDMGRRGYFSHNTPEGITPGQRITAAGYIWSAFRENIAAGQRGAAEVMQAWMNSPGHRVNILSTDVCDLGVGHAFVGGSRYGNYWTQKFGRRQGVVTCPPVDPPVDPTPNRPPTVGLRYSPANPTTADTVVLAATASDPDGDPLTYEWFLNRARQEVSPTATEVRWRNPREGTHTVLVRVSDGRGGTAEDSVTFTVTAPGAPPVADISYTYGNVAGWYLISFPVSAPPLRGITMWRWDPVTRAYVRPVNLSSVEGAWARLAPNTTVTITGGTPVTGNIGLRLGVAGWHMVSAPWNYPRAAIVVERGGERRSWADAVAAGWVRNAIYGFRATDGAYTMPTMLHPWYGYWLQARVPGLALLFVYASRATAMGLLSEAEQVVPLWAVPMELPPPPPGDGAALGEVQFGNVPNPITDVRTTTFQVLGPLAGLVTDIRVAVFDLSGRLVWQGSAAGAELEWSTTDLAGRHLANGIYLYQITARVDGTTVSSGILRLAIFR